MKTKTAILFFSASLAVSLSSSQAAETKSESGLMAVKSIIYSATSIGGAGAYASSENAACDFSLAPTVPRCMNSIFGLLQMELSLQGLDNSRKIAIHLLDEGNSNLSIDLKNEGFCIHPLVDSCIQDAVEKEVVTIYQALKDGTNASYEAAVQNLQTQIDGKLAAFTAVGYVIDKQALTVTPPFGAPQSFAGGQTVASGFFVQSKNKFQSALNRTDTFITEVQSLNSNTLLQIAQSLISSGVLSGAVYAADPSPTTSSRETQTFSSKTSASKSPGQIFFAEFTDVQREVSLVAPQGEEVFGSVSSRYQKMLKSGDFIQP